MADNRIVHPRNRFPKESPIINLEQWHLFILKEEFHLRMDKISCDLQRIKDSKI